MFREGTELIARRAVDANEQLGESSSRQDEELDTVRHLSSDWDTPRVVLHNSSRIDPTWAVLIRQVEAVMNKLGVERRVQFGAEKMLHVSRPLSSAGAWQT